MTLPLPKGSKFKIKDNWDSIKEGTWYNAGESYTVAKYLPEKDYYNVEEEHHTAWIGAEAIDWDSVVYPSHHCGYLRVQKIVQEQLGIDHPIAPETSWIDLGADSLDTVELVMALEEEFETEIPDEEAEKMFTIPDVLNYLENPSPETFTATLDSPVTTSTPEPKNVSDEFTEAFSVEKEVIYKLKSRGEVIYSGNKEDMLKLKQAILEGLGE